MLFSELDSNIMYTARTLWQLKLIKVGNIVDKMKMDMFGLTSIRVLQLLNSFIHRSYNTSSH